MYEYTFTGHVAEDFLALPADPPSCRLQPGDTVATSEPVAHARLEPANQAAENAAEEAWRVLNEVPPEPEEVSAEVTAETPPPPDAAGAQKKKAKTIAPKPEETAPQGSPEPPPAASDAPQA